MLTLRERLTYSLLGILPKSSVAEVEQKNNAKKKHKKKNKKNKSTKLNNHYVVEEEDEDDFVSVSSDKIGSDNNDPDNTIDDVSINVNQFQPINYQKQLLFNFENAQIGIYILIYNVELYSAFLGCIKKIVIFQLFY